MTLQYPPNPTVTFQPPFPPGWYADPWRISYWRWWDGYQWTPYLQGLVQPPLVQTRAPKGPGIKGGGVAAIGAGIGLVASVAVSVAFIFANPGHFDADNPWYLLSSQFALWFGFVGSAVLASFRNGTRSLVKDYGLSWPQWRDLYRGLLGGTIGRLPVAILVVLILVIGNQLNTPTNAGRQIDGMTPEGRVGWIVTVFLLVVGAPIVEELFFRGLIQGAFTRRIGPVPAIFVTALIFSSAHVLNEGPFAPFVLFPTALVLGYLRRRYGRLAPGMIAHSTFNALGLALIFLVPGFR